MRKTPLLSALAVLATLQLPTASAAFGFPDGLTETGRIIEDIYVKIFIAAVLVFILVMGLLLWVIVRYREGSGHGRATFEAHRHNTAAEVTWTVIPLGIMLWIGFISYIGLVEIDEVFAPGEEDYTIHVIGSQWNWEAQYGNGVSVFADPDTQNGMVRAENAFKVPADRNILWNITASDVIHAFFVTDANEAPVGFVDANPNGQHRYNHLPMRLPEGEYFVQCREMCFNPGHAYMRARIQAVPQADYDLWIAQREAAVGADVVEEMQLNVTASGVELDANITGVTGTRFVVTVDNQAAQAVTFQVTGQEDQAVAANERRVVTIDMPQAGEKTLRVLRGDEVLTVTTFTAVDAEEMTVDMGNFYFDPETLEFEAGKTYLIRLFNEGTAAHNLFIGPDFDTTLAASPTIGPGGTGTLLFTPEQSGSLVMWCNVPGHLQQGMDGTVQIA